MSAKELSLTSLLDRYPEDFHPIEREEARAFLKEHMNDWEDAQSALEIWENEKMIRDQKKQKKKEAPKKKSKAAPNPWIN